MLKYAAGTLLDVRPTIELNNALQRVVQAKAKMNKTIREEAIKYMEPNASNENLVLNPY